MSDPLFSAASTPEPFKGIALFTPGGDLIYCIDPKKQTRWHLHLCAALQDLLGLSESPHFLVPCYTATLDYWLDPHTQQPQIAAEAAPRVLRYQALLNVLFAAQLPSQQTNPPLTWTVLSMPEGICDPCVLETYRQQFPELWESHDLVMRYEQAMNYVASEVAPDQRPAGMPALLPDTQGYVLRLYISGNSTSTERTLQNLYRLLESLPYPYTLKVIDVYQRPELAEQDQVSATPTFVKVWPRPLRRIVGDLETFDQLLRILGPFEHWDELG